MAANLTQILNFKANFQKEVELFSEIEFYANNGGHIKIVGIMKINYRYRTPVLIINFFYQIYSLCKNNAVSKVLNKLHAFYFRSTVYTNTTTTVITHSYVL